MFSQPIIQSCIVFIFLTIFFFSYVSSIEKEEFETQLDTIVDDIYTEYQPKISSLFPKDETKKELAKTTIYGIIDNTENKIETSTKTQDDTIDKQNQKIIYNAIYFVIGYIILCIVILCIFYFIGIKISLKDNLTEGLFILVFIFLTEYIFLNIIAKRYISGNSNYVTQKITTTILDYINKRKNDLNLNLNKSN
jgi:protein-S-isoprenylcysteine O-methyltransferase Ste14